MQRFFASYPGTSWRLVLFALTVPMVVVSAAFIWLDYQSRRDAITTQVQLQSAQVNAQLEDFVHTVRGVSGQFADYWVQMYPPTVGELGTQESQASLLRRTQSFRPHFSNMFITDVSGRVSVSSQGYLPGQRVGPESLYQRAIATGDFTVSDVVLASDDLPPFVLFVQPLNWNGDGPNGFVVFQSDLDVISSVLDMSNVDFPHTGKSGIFDSTGRILAGTGYELPHPGLLVGRDISGSTLWAQAATRPQSSWFGPGLDDIDRIVFFEYPDSTPWVTTVAYAQSELFDPLWRRLWIFGAALAATAGAILIVGEFAIRRERRSVAMLRAELDQRESAERALQSSEAKFRQLFDDAPIGYQEVDVTGRITRVNQTELAMLGYKSEELLGHPVWSFMSDQNKARQIIESKIEGATSTGVAYELGFVRKDGSILPALIEDRLIRDETGQVIGLRSTVHDITERKKTEARIQEAGRLTSLGELAAGVAHEINNPLTEVVGLSEILMDQDLPQPVAKYAQQINAASRRAARIGTKLLDFARKRDPAKQYAFLPDVLTRALELKQLGPDIEVETIWPDDLPRTMLDEHQMIQVIINLLTNSQQALSNKPGIGRIVVEAAKLPGKLRITITDDGNGIAPEHLYNIFDPFFTTKEVGDGTGLGLSLCYGIVRQHEGEIWAESKLGLGTTIKIDLPIVSPEPGVLHEVEELPVNGFSRLKILVVDDEQGIRDMLKDMLSEYGHTVDVASDGGQASAMISERNYDCIIMDLKMPKVGGQRLYERLADLNPAMASRVMFMTGDTIGGSTREFLDENPNPVISKPFNLKDLRHQIEKLSSLLPSTHTG